MLRTNNKRLHSNLWTLAHFVGSAFVFLMVFVLIYYFQFIARGAYTDPTTAVSTTKPEFQYTWVNALMSSNTFLSVLPVTSLVKFVIPWNVSNNGLTGLPFVFGLAFDFVLWFNVALWTLQLIVFVPDACFHWLEKKKED